MNWRLSTLAPDILEQLVSFDEDLQRELASRFAQAALAAVPVDDAGVDRAVDLLRSGAFDDGALRDELQALVDALDQQQWDYEARIDAGATDLADPHGFARVRAVSALVFAFDHDALTAAAESAYEADAACPGLLRAVFEGRA
jgi:hypothetical protein